ncbi:heme biosynthesis HemY N-terminal domain-containing protein [uncultured Cohaesibacter sp.]|uniref:heme biosynthesis protein HemY n=1 Tax=uncultured Cohaesibacter sp. TaxID=1002546 RepID=UPI002AA7B2B4|nr:heme biosynthesis HemY N-terminal domain-containing protein [uncultured Cohaesibacter sp.]
MIKALIFFAVLLAIAFGGAWLADRPGEIIINWPWLDMGFEVSLLMGFLLIVAAMGVAVVLWIVIKGIWNSPRSVTGFFSSRRRDKGYKALSTGMIAVGVGDLALARKQAAKARKLIGQEPMTLMLEAQTAQLAGEPTKARQSFEAMLDTDETRALGRRGLYIEAQRRGDMEEALQMAKAATDESKKAPGWAGAALFDMQTAGEDWQGALVTLSQNYANKHIEKADFRRQRAVILTAQAMELEGEDDADLSMRPLLSEACKLAPGLVPAVTRQARILNDARDFRKASKLVEAAWRIEPHPDLAEAYAYIKDGDTALDRLKRIRVLFGLMPDHVESKLAMARAFIDAREWAEARSLLQPMAESHLTPRICMLMAELEEGEKNDFGLVRQWLARSVGAHRDPAWTADGQVSDIWQPISPVTGKIDAYEWKVPVREAAQAEQPVLDSSELESSSEEKMVLIPSEGSEDKAKAFVVSEDAVEEITPEEPDQEEPAEETEPEGQSEATSAPVVEEVAVKDAEPMAPAALQEHDNAKFEGPVEEEKPEAVIKQAEPADPKADSVDKTAEKVEIEKPKEVEFPMPFPPDDPGPKKDGVARKPEKRFKLF